MLRKSYSSEWAGQMTMPEAKNEAAMHSVALQHNFDELRQEMNDFNQVFSSWMGRRRKALIEDKEAYMKTMSEEQDLVEELKKQLVSLVARRQNIVAGTKRSARTKFLNFCVALQAEDKEFDEGKQANAELEVQKNVLTQRIAEIRQEVSVLKERIAKDEAELGGKEQVARMQAQREQLEILLSQEKLGLFIESTKENVTKFTFKFIDRQDWERKFILTIDVGNSRYLVRQCEPMIHNLAFLIDELNQGGVDFFGFLHRVRTSFVQIANNHNSQ